MTGRAGMEKAYVRVRGRWAHLCRAVDGEGRTPDFRLSPTRSARAAERFLGEAVRAREEREAPLSLATGKAPTRPLAVAGLKREGRCPPEVAHRPARRLDDRIEADHGRLERLIRPTLGFGVTRAPRGARAAPTESRTGSRARRAWSDARSASARTRRARRSPGSGPWAWRRSRTAPPPADQAPPLAPNFATEPLAGPATT